MRDFYAALMKIQLACVWIIDFVAFVIISYLDKR